MKKDESGNWIFYIIRIGAFHISLAGGPDNSRREFSIKLFSLGPEGLSAHLLVLFALNIWFVSFEVFLHWA